MTHIAARLFAALILLGIGCHSAPTEAQNADPYDTGGPLMAEQAAYDVLYYGVDVQVFPDSQSIEGTLEVRAHVGSPLSWFVLDLAPEMTVRSVQLGDHDTAFDRRGGRIWIALPFTAQPGDTIEASISYGGAPRVAPNPPWDGGFTWASTASGAPWIATSVQGEGADIWWPVKDHVSDKPESMDIRVRVPSPLVVASNGRLKDIMTHDDATTTWHWHVSTPISAYNVALNIAPYVILEDAFNSVAGDHVPIQFFVLPEDEQKARAFLPEVKEHLAFFESYLGPYPFRGDKYGVAQTPHLGMEHQSIIAYGAGFKNTSMTRGVDYGYDALHQHELAHEWWGNLVTNSDWADMWLHEGFGSYMQPLYSETLGGDAEYRKSLMNQRRGIQNQKAVAPEGPLSEEQIYTGHDIYSKGSWVLHSLRWLVGDTVFFSILRRQAYPDPALEATTDGSAIRFATTTDFQHLAESIHGQPLDWFVDVYLRQPALPEPVLTRDGVDVTVRWNVPGNAPFPMPIPVSVDGEVRRVDLTDGVGRLTVPENATVALDPENRLLHTLNN